MKKNIFIILLLLIGEFIIIHILFKNKSSPQTKVVTKTTIIDTIHHLETIFYPNPIAKTKRIIKIDTIILPSVTSKDSTPIIIPIEQKEYKERNYLAYVSGYKPSLDSIFIYNDNKEIIKTITYTKNNRFSIGIVSGIGYGINSKKIEPFIGVGASIRLK